MGRKAPVPDAPHGETGFFSEPFRAPVFYEFANVKDSFQFLFNFFFSFSGPALRDPSACAWEDVDSGNHCLKTRVPRVQYTVITVFWSKKYRFGSDTGKCASCCYKCKRLTVCACVF